MLCADCRMPGGRGGRCGEAPDRTRCHAASFRLGRRIGDNSAVVRRCAGLFFAFMENLLAPTQAVLSIAATRVLVFAPHPDDEIFGCGGALRQFAAADIPVRVIVVTDGGEGPPAGMARADYVAMRQQESRRAAGEIGCESPVFWSHPDRSLRYGERLVVEFCLAIEDWQADLIFAPSLTEIHPDHRVTALAVREAARRVQNCRLAFYEIGQPLPRPNLLLDISSHVQIKQAAMACFASQQERQDYAIQISALNRYRTYTLGTREVAAIEAFRLIEAENLDIREVADILSAPLSIEEEAGAPLVSVIVRSMDQPTLDETLASVALQTYPNVEVVLVNAKGPGHRSMDAWCGRFPLRLVSGAGPLTRSQAANAGIDAIRGLFFAFLDDDDTLDADHYARLVAAAGNPAGHLIPYAGVRSRNRRDPTGAVLNIFAERWEEGKLLAGNFMPIHAPLVPSALLAKGVRFDTSFEIYEDWDFWLQLAQQTRFVLCEGVTATYFTDGDSGVNPLSVDGALMQRATLAIYAKWIKHLGPDALWQVARLYHDRNLARHTCHIEHSQLENTLGQLHETLTGAQSNLCVANGQLDETRNQLDETRNQLDWIRAELADVYNSRSWRITAPLRAFLAMLRHS